MALQATEKFALFVIHLNRTVLVATKLQNLPFGKLTQGNARSRRCGAAQMRHKTCCFCNASICFAGQNILCFREEFVDDTDGLLGIALLGDGLLDGGILARIGDL